MFVFLVQRLFQAVLTVWMIVTAVFFATRVIPGDPAEIMLGDYATPALIEQVREGWGLNEPIATQYLLFMWDLVNLDLGDSMRNRQPVYGLISQQVGYTARLVFISLALGILVALPLGVLAAVRRGSFFDTASMALCFMFIAMPSFWLGLLLLLLFSVVLGWFPAIGAETEGDVGTYFRYLALPVTTVTVRSLGGIARMVRSSVLDELPKDYVRVARSKGLEERVVLWRHMLRNALAPIVSLIGVELVVLLGGVVMIEVVFSRPGLGYLYVQAVAARDYPLLQGCVLAISVAVVVVNLLVDLSYALIDPRVTY